MVAFGCWDGVLFVFLVVLLFVTGAWRWRHHGRLQSLECDMAPLFSHRGMGFLVYRVYFLAAVTPDISRVTFVINSGTVWVWRLCYFAYCVTISPSWLYSFRGYTYLNCCWLGHVICDSVTCRSILLLLGSFQTFHAEWMFAFFI